MNAPRLLLFALLLLATGGWECAASYTKDPGFDVWCDDQLCHWEVEEGVVEPIPTWHEGDSGARLSGGAVISQVLALKSSVTTCLAVTLLATQESGGILRFELDFLDDSSVEVTRDIELGDGFSEQRFSQRTPSWFQGVRVRVRQLGNAVTLARLRIEGAQDCGTQPAPQLFPRPLGASCDNKTQCQSDLCAKAPLPLGSGSVCSQCDENTPCAGDGVCGIDYAEGLGAYYGCGPAGRFELGAFCIKDAGCASGHCWGEICSECYSSDDCEAMASCTYPALGGGDAEENKDRLPFLPKVCASETADGLSGEHCNQHQDCASGHCVGELWKRCLFSSASCETDDDCPRSCLELGLQDGVCE